jgi:hypothetical protein
MTTGPIRLFVGCAAGVDAESQAVLEYTVRTQTTRPVEITWMYQARKGPWSGWATTKWRTPFTGYRWGIPAACGYQGKAIYMDSDFIVRADLGELWDQPVSGVGLVRNATGKLTTSCILFDCAHAQSHVPDLATLRPMPDAHGTLLAYFRARPHLLAEFAGDWDCIDLKGYEDLADPRIKAIHYSRIETQLQLTHALPRLAREGRSHWYTGPVGPHWRPELQALFDQLLEEAAAAGYTVDRYQTDTTTLTRSNFVYTTSKVSA